MTKAESNLTSIIVMADYGCGLWTKAGGTFPATLGLNADYCLRFDEWLASYCEDDDCPDGFDRVVFNRAGRELALELRDFLHVPVKYRFISLEKREPGDLQWEEEML